MGSNTAEGRSFTATSGSLSYMSNHGPYPTSVQSFTDFRTVSFLDSLLSELYHNRTYSRFQIILLPNSASVEMSQGLFGELIPEGNFKRRASLNRMCRLVDASYILRESRRPSYERHLGQFQFNSAGATKLHNSPRRPCQPSISEFPTLQRESSPTSRFRTSFGLRLGRLFRRN